MVEALNLALALAALTAVILSLPFGLSAIDYRRRDNGLAYMLLVAGVTVWNGMLFMQLLSANPAAKVYFLSLSVVGAVLSGLGFFLFAATADSTPDYLNRRSLFGIAGILGGLDIVFAATAPAHRFYWSIATEGVAARGFALIDPAVGYWIHTLALATLFGAGVLLFMHAWVDHPADRYRLAYGVGGTATVLGIVLSNVAVPGGFGVAPILAAGLTSIGWFQASRGEPMAWVRGITG